ncbi:MAG: 2-oxoacid:acceptor oxidoreductase family protein [candidate division KSB1 bacterium]|nr:2-oxoacid:acceptor oxidoreductase family protein [candidate division KSB1 bacterium]
MAANAFLKPNSFYSIYERKSGLKDVTHYCPGCGHGVLHKLIAEALDDFKIRERTILISPVGCSVFAYYYFRVGNIQCAHGRAPAVATGIKRVHPHSIVISYQGDGDLAAIGANNILQAANRGEAITVFFVNNAIYGMTGGQMAPTTLMGQKTTTTPFGRHAENEGFPLRVSELISVLEAPVYVERTAITDAAHIMKTRAAVRKALRNQIDNKGFSLVEVLSACPSGWKMTPVEAKHWIEEEMFKVFPLGVYKDISDRIAPRPAERRSFSVDGIAEKLELPKETSVQTEISATKERNERLVIAGFGGQGILVLGIGLAQAGMINGYHVSWLPSYGPEMRGGTANCHVTLSTHRVGSPLVSKPTVLIAMNLPSLDKFEPIVVPGGWIIYDSSLIHRQPMRNDVKSLAIPATQMADELGNTRVANMIILGAYIALSGILPAECAMEALPFIIKRKNLLPLNRTAVEKGMEFVRNAGLAA